MGRRVSVTHHVSSSLFFERAGGAEASTGYTNPRNTNTHTQTQTHTHAPYGPRILRARRSPHTCDPSLIVQAKPAIGSRTSFSYTALSRFESDLQAAKRRGHACATCKQLGQQSEHVVREPRRVHEPARAPNRYPIPHQPRPARCPRQ